MKTIYYILRGTVVVIVLLASLPFLGLFGGLYHIGKGDSPLEFVATFIRFGEWLGIKKECL